MIRIFTQRMRGVIVGIALLLMFTHCEPEVMADRLVYSNDFEENDYSFITSTRINFHAFNGSQVLGHFNRDTLKLRINNLPDHNYVFMAFDLYIHDSWDGNKDGVDGPDLWGFSITTRPYGGISTRGEHSLITSFSNNNCTDSYCGFNFQSFPNQYPFLGTPKSNSVMTSAGFCALKDEEKGTTLYRIEELFPDRSSDLTIKIFDHLVQGNVRYPYCDESWSIDNIEIRALDIN